MRLSPRKAQILVRAAFFLGGSALVRFFMGPKSDPIAILLLALMATIVVFAVLLPAARKLCLHADVVPRSPASNQVPEATNRLFDPDFVQKSIQDAAQLPLADAAYAFWSQKQRLDQAEKPTNSAPTAQVSRFADPGYFAKVTTQAIATLQFDADNAAYGPTFARLKSAHREASDDDLRDAIALAVKLERAFFNDFSYSNVRPYREDVQFAIDKARRDNPEFTFSESTYKRLLLNMLQDLR